MAGVVLLPKLIPPKVNPCSVYWYLLAISIGIVFRPGPPRRLPARKPQHPGDSLPESNVYDTLSPSAPSSPLSPFLQLPHPIIHPPAPQYEPPPHQPFLLFPPSPHTLAPPALPLLDARPGLALVGLHGVQHHLGRVVGRVALVALGPVVADGVGEDAARLVERCRRDAAADVRVPLEAVLGVLVPEVERPVAARRAEGAVLRVERDVVDRVHVGHVALRRVAVAFEGEVEAG
ncbi:hypothetical protein VTK26DRAFT_3440 [Humicola hyalothermophila]